MNISSINNTNYVQLEYKSIADTLNKYDEEEFSFTSDIESTPQKEYISIFKKAEKFVEQENILPEVVAFNNMQNRMKISDVYA